MHLPLGGGRDLGAPYTDGSVATSEGYVARAPRPLASWTRTCKTRAHGATTTGKPVVTSTQAFMWSMLRMAGVSDRIGGYGSLFSRC